ncbi:MAG: hypothetical protein IJL02_05875 [Methanobrevibacter sp.]|uniref:hypothetical protein n=1 Tax=Methanobrevibacter sp. TaxID=66852 RepID=UPI0025CD95DB|nr:hypothetical protein [Methanobrevibacter sp.]MBQ6099375.1 hypothetical protein [Methanobrevibacter sp.]
MDITKFPQFQLYLLTLMMFDLKDQLIPDACDNRCIYSTIINRAYFSSYLFCELWLDYEKNFRVTSIKNFGDDEEIISEHLQVRNALFNFGEKNMELNLSKLSKLRKTADYDPFRDLTQKDVSDAVEYMKRIFSHLKFD